MQNNLWGSPQCTKGWEGRCARAICAECTCACGGENHGIAKSSVGEPIKSENQTLYMTVQVFKTKALPRSSKLGYVASGTHKGVPYSFAGFTPLDAIEKALKYIAKRQ